MFVSELELEMVTVGRESRLDSELGALDDVLSMFSSMSFQWTALLGFLGVPELMLRTGLREGGRSFRQ